MVIPVELTVVAENELIVPDTELSLISCTNSISYSDTSLFGYTKF
jgi:hypothetical protein